jgi:tRNA (guanine37-N1)-methyltransferase
MRRRVAGNLKQNLAGVVPAEQLPRLRRAYEVVGDIALIAIAPSLMPHVGDIARAVLAANRQIKVVAVPTGIYGGEFRLRPLRVIAGENRLETEAREFGVRLLLHLERVYYSGRSGQERRRIAALVTPGESVLVLFSGVAPFPLVISAHARPRLVVGIEKNPEAHRYALENLRRNPSPAQVVLYCADAWDLADTLVGRFDRVLLPLPGGAEPFLPLALAALEGDGWLHFYDMQPAQGEKEAIDKVARACTAAGRELAEVSVTRCGHCGPHLYRLCVNALIRGEKAA